MGKKCELFDGCVAMIKLPGDTAALFVTEVHPASVTVRSLARCFELGSKYGFGSRASEIRIVAKNDRVTISAVVPLHSTGQLLHDVRRDFLGVLREAGVMSHPAFSPLVVPLHASHYRDARCDN